MKSLSRVQLFVTPWTVAYQAPQSMGFSRQKYWSGLPFPSPGDLPNPGIEPGSPTLQADTLPSEPPGKLPKKGNAKECSNYHTAVFISHTSEVMLKILQARLQQCMNRELPDVQAGFRKGRGTRDQIANIHWIMEKAREFQRNSSALLTMPKPLTVCITINCGKFWKGWEYQTTWPASLGPVCRSRSGS